jgi:hypothetical protein
MKYLVLAIAALGLFSCTSSKNVAQNNSKQRTIASLQEMGFNEADANSLELEVANYQAPAGVATVSPLVKFNESMKLLKSFGDVAASKGFSQKQKIAIMKNDVLLARKRLINQTGGSGMRYMYFSSKIENVEKCLNSGDTTCAVHAANEPVPGVHAFIKNLSK